MNCEQSTALRTSVSDRSLQARELPIEREILNLLVSATPEGWSKIDYAVDVTWFETCEGLVCDITSPEGHDAAYAPVPGALKQATIQLLNLMKEYGLRLKSLRGHAWLDDQGRWMYQVDYEYDQPPGAGKLE